MRRYLLVGVVAIATLPLSVSAADVNIGSTLLSPSTPSRQPPAANDNFGVVGSCLDHDRVTVSIHNTNPASMHTWGGTVYFQYDVYIGGVTRGNFPGGAVRSYILPHNTSYSGYIYRYGVFGTKANGGFFMTDGNRGIYFSTPNCSPTPSCTVNVSPTSVNKGGSATLSWSSSNANNWFYIANVGYVSASGSTRVAPNTTTSYSGSANGYGQTVNCSGNQTLTVSPLTRLDPPTPPPRDPEPLRPVVPCPSGQILQNGQCITTACPTGFARVGDQCERIECPAGWTLSGNICLRPESPEFVAFTGTRGDGPSFDADGSLMAVPALVRSGDTVRVYWSVENVRNCSVSGSNGDSWSSTSSGSGGRQTSNISARTVYSLSCQGYPGTSPATIQDTAIVNIAPSFNEF